jgi:hypothetical protein
MNFFGRVKAQLLTYQFRKCQAGADYFCLTLLGLKILMSSFFKFT